MNGYVSVIFFVFWAADILLARLINETSHLKTRGSAASAEKVEAGERLDFDDGVTLYRSPDILGVGWMANRVRERLHGDKTYFNVNRHINPTDVCVASCRLCAFGKKRARIPTAYTMSLEQVWERAGHGCSEAVTEFHIVGGLHPELTLDWYCQMLRGLKQRFPQVHLKAFTMVEIGLLRATREDQRSRRRSNGCATPAWIRCPAAARRFSRERVRRIICDHKITGDSGWTSRAPRMSSGCIPTAPCSTATSRRKRIASITWCKLRALQDETSGFVTFIPLAFHPENTALQHIPKTTGFDDIREIAVSRLMLDNIPHIKAYWIMMTPRIAQIAQRFGADDIDGTVVEEKIYHDAGATTSQICAAANCCA